MSPEVARAMQAIAQSLMASRPNEARQLQQWLQSGGQMALPAGVLTLALSVAPTVGVPAAVIMAAIKNTQGAPATETMDKVPGGGLGTGAGAIGANALPAQAGGSAGGNIPTAMDEFGHPASENYANTVAINQLQNQQATPPPAASTGGLRDNSSPDYPGRQPVPPPSSPAPGGGGTGGGNPGGFASGFGDFLSGNDDGLVRFAMQAAGFNPDIVTPASRIAAQKLAALVKSRRAAFGAGNPDQNVGGLPQDIASFAKEYTTPGVDFYGNARKYAQGVLGGGMEDMLGGVADQAGRFGQYQALTPMLYGGSNPLIQQAVSDQLGNIYDKWNLDQAMDPTNPQKMDILQFIRSQPNLNPLLRSIFGPQK